MSNNLNILNYDCSGDYMYDCALISGGLLHIPLLSLCMIMR